MQVKDIMVRKFDSVGPDASVKDVIKTMIKSGVSGVPVVDKEGNLVGLVPIRSIVARGRAGGAEGLGHSPVDLDPNTFVRQMQKLYGTTAKEIMTHEVISVDEKAELPRIVELMLDHRVDRLPVVRRGKVVGMVTGQEVLKAILELEMDWEEKLEKLGDEDIYAMVMNALRRNMGVSQLNMRVKVRDGVVHLQGSVGSLEDLRGAGDIAASIPGVKSVDNALLVEGMLA